MTRPNPQSAIRNPQSACAVACVCALVASLILSPFAAAGEARHADAVNVFHCTFGDKWDVNYDHWPDRWVRKTGANYPHYVSIGIQPDDSATSKKCLRIDLDGAAAAVASPPIRVMPRFSYVFEAQVKNEHLTHSTVVLTLDFCDSTGHVVQTKRSAPLSTTKGWKTVQIEQVEPSDPAIDRVVLGLEVHRAAKGDLHGRVSLADVRFARLPRIVVSTNNPSNVYTALDDVVVQCELSGIPERDPEIRFQLLDSLNNNLQSDRHRLDGRLIVDGADKAGEITDGDDRRPDGFEGTTEWRPKIPDYGYYRIVVQMLSSKSDDSRSDADRELASRTIYLAVVPPLPMPRQGEFGWTLPHGDAPLSFQDLSRLLPQVGINWVKVPVWFDANDSRRADDMIRFIELLGATNIDVVGIIDQPPATSETAAPSSRNVPIAELLSTDSTTWATLLEPVMSRLSLRVRWWQLGRDGDLSFVGFPNLNKRMQDIRTALFRFGQDVRMGVSWDWASLNSGSGNAGWDFQQLVSETPPTEEQFAELLNRPRENNTFRWVTINPPLRYADATESNETTLLDSAALLPAFCAPVTNVHDLLAVASEYGGQLARSSELVRRMVSAKMRGADAIIVPDPFNDDNGLMRESGMPGELLLPWRTTAAMLGGASYMGQMQLPSGSENRIFVRPDGQVVMVVWNHMPVDEALYLGEGVKHYDIFGRSTSPAVRDGEQTIHVGPTPSFLLGLHEGITRWRMAVEFEKRQVPSIFAKPHPNALRFRNFFPQGVGGSFKIVVLPSRIADELAPSEPAATESSGFTLDRWTIEPPQSTFQLAADSEMKFPFEIELRNALFGKQSVRIDFKVEADQEYAFSVYSELEVGTEDLTLDVTSHLDKDGTLVVEQLMTNSAEQLADFKCFLRAKGHRRQRMQVYRLGKELDRKVYRFGGGDKLVGEEMLLEIEELNGPRELRYRFVAKDSPVQANDTDKEKLRPRTANERKPEPRPADVARSVDQRF
ncbi:MAG: hypothetical protein L0228_16775 [Planctomycetes bacterium]|nr:hypothetical protein [Planctomycetota bacterium]